MDEMKPEVIGGIGEKNFGRQWRQGNRVYDGSKIATAVEANPVGNCGGFTNLYDVEVEVKEATARGYSVARGGAMPLTSRCREAKQEGGESG